MKITETILLIGLGGVIAYLAFGRKNEGEEKSLGGGGGFGADLRSLEAVDVIEPQAPINVNVTTTTPVQPTRDVTEGQGTGGGAGTGGDAGTGTEPVKPTKEDGATSPTESFVDPPRRRKSNFGSQQFVILENTQFPIQAAPCDDEFDVDEM